MDALQNSFIEISLCFKLAIDYAKQQSFIIDWNRQ